MKIKKTTKKERESRAPKERVAIVEKMWKKRRSSMNMYKKPFLLCKNARRIIIPGVRIIASAFGEFKNICNLPSKVNLSKKKKITPEIARKLLMIT